MYRYIVYLHILGALGFMIAHGASASMAFRLRKEKDMDRIRAMLDLSGFPTMIMYLSLLVLLVAGITLGFMGHWWNRGWIWTSIGLFLAIAILMGVLGQRHYHGLRKLVGLPYFEGSKEQPATEPASQGEIEAKIGESSPIFLSMVGFGGIAIILWLMMFKPF
jgi:uncharacterized membrane protein